uniref:Uncharacterized protein n=1 Tax=Alexandrium monilatum TaxID=311494 RepID=A0A7S4UBV4_9DINO
MRAVLAAAWPHLWLSSGGVGAASLGPTPVLGAELPALARGSLDYCPPIADSFIDFSCVDNSSRTAVIAFLSRRAEEILWAIANAREVGRLGLEKTTGVLSFLESFMLLLCWSRLDCAFRDGEAARNYWSSHFIARCREMQMRAPVLPGENPVDLCTDSELQTSLLARIRGYVLSEADRSEVGDAVHAVFPPDVSPVCEDITGEVVGPMWPLAQRAVLQGTYMLSVAMEPLVAVMGFVARRGHASFVVNLGASDGKCQAQAVRAGPWRADGQAWRCTAASSPPGTSARSSRPP